MNPTTVEDKSPLFLCIFAILISIGLFAGAFHYKTLPLHATVYTTSCLEVSSTEICSIDGVVSKGVIKPVYIIKDNHGVEKVIPKKEVIAVVYSKKT